MEWAKPPENREQIVLFAEKLDDAIDPNHPVRLLDKILRGVDWRPWEAKYKLTRGMPPIHPSVLASVILYGLLKRIRTSRGLEEALKVRLDFRWLAEGRTIDHTTISKFRQNNSECLGDLFVQIGLIARQMGHLTLVTLGYDGTRMRASNRRSGTRTPEELRQAKQQLAEEFRLHQQAAGQAQQLEDEVFNAAETGRSEKDLRREMQRVDQALAEIERIESEGKQVPERLPITDPHCRIAKNKEGGFGPNYNPTVTVDVESGLLVDSDVIRGTDEQSHMIEAVTRAREHFGDESVDPPVVEVLADGLMATASNIVECPESGIEFYSPGGAENPAHREDPSDPVAADKIDALPLRGKKPRRGEVDRRTFDKSAFVYDADHDIYWCPMGKRLERRSKRKDHRGDERFLYRADKRDCSVCPLKSRCFTNSRKQYGRRIECGKHERATQAHATKMRRVESRAKYSRRAAATERPFAVIKYALGARSFLSRGIHRVRAEWTWLTIACNLHRLLYLLGLRGGTP